jgi:hypothetical protein
MLRGGTAGEAHAVTDLIAILLTLGFFALAWLYAKGCDRL